MALSSSSRKTVPLSSGCSQERQKAHTTDSPYLTKTAFFSAVVVEGIHDNTLLSADVQELLASLGDTLIGDNETLSNTYDYGGDQGCSHRGANTYGSEREFTDYKALADLVDELISTERSYVKRLRILKESYADPLRSYARNKDTAIIPAYEAKILFGNIDYILPVNQAFLYDLESLSKDDQQKARNIGDIALKHFKDLRAFECYKQYYAKREEAQAIFKREMNKKSSTGFAAFVERIKYSSTDLKIRVGLRELLMDPVQRIPRYTLMFRSIIKFMDSSHPERAKLIEADEIASKIALAETDVDTKRAAIMYSLAATVDEFPPALISNNRRYIDCIDVDDKMIEYISLTTTSTSISSAGTASGTLHCTLFLFDDKLLIAKRPGEKSGRVLAGLDDLEKLTNAGALSRGPFKKSGLICKGVVDIVDVIATDVTGADFHIYFENPPKDQSGRWSCRPFRDLTVVHPAFIDQDISQIQHEKKRFLENLWNAQALYRTKLGQSVALCTGDKEVEARPGKIIIARTYFNIYERTSFLRERNKTKVVLHIDPSGCSDPIPFGFQSPPFIVVRVQPMAGELCRYIVTTNEPDDEVEEDIVQTARIPARIIHTIYQLDLFKFNTNNCSRPNTPTTSIRSRANIFGLEAISRNFFGIKQNSVKGESVPGKNLIEQHKRSKSLTSRASVRTDTTATTSDSLMKFSCRSLSTAATSFTDDEGSRSMNRPRKLSKRGRSPSLHSSGELLAESARHEVSRSKSCENSSDNRNPSDLDLTMRLELARKNSRNQRAENQQLQTLRKEISRISYEDEPPIAIRATSQIRSASTVHERRPFGPRASSSLQRDTPSPEPVRDIRLSPTHRISPDRTGGCLNSSPMIFKQRQAIEPSGNMETFKFSLKDNKNFTVEPLSIKKKRFKYVKSFQNEGDEIHFKTISRDASLVTKNPMLLKTEQLYSDENELGLTVSILNKLLLMAHTTKEYLNVASCALKKIKIDLDEQSLKGQQMDEKVERRVGSPQPTSPQVHAIKMTKEAEEQMLEIQQLIQQHTVDDVLESRLTSKIKIANSPTYSCSRRHLSDFRYDDVDTIDDHIAKALCNEDSLVVCLEQVVSDVVKKKPVLNEATAELLKTRRQCELMKNLLADAAAENEILYESFNEELDGMFDDISLPKDESWVAMTEDLRRTKDSRNNLIKENTRLKRRLEEAISERDGWIDIMRYKG